MTNQEFGAQFLNVYNIYTNWLVNNVNPVYGQQPLPGAYGGAVSPSFDGFIKWLEHVYPFLV